MKTNITIISLLSDFSKDIGKLLSDKLEMYYVDIQELMEFNLVNDEEVIKLCGVEYLNKLQAKTVADVSGYDNAVITIDYKFLVHKKNIENLKVRSSIIYLATNQKTFLKLFDKYKTEENEKDDVVELAVFDEHDEYLRKISDIVIDIDKATDKGVVKKIIKTIEKYYE